MDPMLACDDPSGFPIGCDICLCGQELVWHEFEGWIHVNLGAAIACKTGPTPRPEGK